MTNGEKFKQIFSITQVDDCDLNVYAWLPIHDAIEIPAEWWNAEYKEPTTKNDLGVDCISRDEVCRYVAEFINHEFSTREEEELIDNIITGIERMPSVTPQEPILDKINKMKSEIADSLEFWDYSPNNNPLARDILETLTNFLGDIREVEE